MTCFSSECLQLQVIKSNDVDQNLLFSFISSSLSYSSLNAITNFLFPHTRLCFKYHTYWSDLRVLSIKWYVCKTSSSVTQNQGIYKNNFKKSPFPFLDRLTFALPNAIPLLQINHYKVPEILSVDYYSLRLARIAMTNNSAWPLLWQLLKSHAGILQRQPIWPTYITWFRKIILVMTMLWSQNQK